MNMAIQVQSPAKRQLQFNQALFNFLAQEVLPQTSLDPATFWAEFSQLIEDFTPRNRELLKKRDSLQAQIDQWHRDQRGQPHNAEAYDSFLRDIGYLLEEGDDFEITTANVDAEIATSAGPQLVVPVQNARFALNAANARWGSLYDAIYGSDLVPQTGLIKAGKEYNSLRGARVIAIAKEFLDQCFPLKSGSHQSVTSYLVYYGHLLAIFADGSSSGLQDPHQFAAFDGSKENPESILLRNHGLHVELRFNRSGAIGSGDPAHIDDIQIEAALTTIMDCEDSVAAVDAEDKIEIYRNWLGLTLGTLEARFEKSGQTLRRALNPDRTLRTPDGDRKYPLRGRSLMLIRNVGMLMDCELAQDEDGNPVPEGIIDAAVTALIASLDLDGVGALRNSLTGSIYIVKPKMHGPEEVAFTCELFSRVEQMLNLKHNTLKLGIMDEERRTTVNLKACIRAARERVVFINTGFLDRTGDEIHTSMLAGPFLPKGLIKDQAWIRAYEDRNVDIGLRCGLSGKAQIGKGMWAMPDEMRKMMDAKIAHPQSGANTAWVPSPTAAVLHALHYHQIDVFALQHQLRKRDQASLRDVLTIPLMPESMRLTPAQIEHELTNNIQGILGYVSRWIEMGIGCSKVPDLNDIGLMEDRATLRISSQHIANWLHHGLCTADQVMQLMERMAAVVDRQNAGTQGYLDMTPNTADSLAFQAAVALVFQGREQPNGYTDPLLHQFRLAAKARQQTN